MKKVKAIVNTITNEKINAEMLNIQFVGEDYVIANFKGYGFTKTYGKFDGYAIEFED